MNIDFWFDPACPWCWRTARWLVAVAPDRDLEIRWRTISLLQKNGGEDAVPEQFRAAVIASHRMLRVAEAVRAGSDGGNEAVGRLYTEIGTQIHHDGIPAQDVDLAPVLKALGLDAAFLSAADDQTYDAAIRASMDEGLRLAGDDVGTPIVGMDGKGALFGPVIDPIPTGQDALRTFDAVATLATAQGFWELKRSRTGAPSPLSERPETALPPVAGSR